MSLFNPWVLLPLFVAFLGVGAAGYSKGIYSERSRQQIEIAKLNQEAREKEQALVVAVNNQTNQLLKAQNEAKIAQQKRVAAIDSGALKLRVPVKTSCPVPATDNPAPPSGNSVQATAELDRETAKALIAITDQGDANTRQLNACVDAYNAVYQTLKGKQ
jgi:hypothetical protein